MKEADGGHCGIHKRRITPETNTYCNIINSDHHHIQWTLLTDTSSRGQRRKMQILPDINPLAHAQKTDARELVVLFTDQPFSSVSLLLTVEITNSTCVFMFVWAFWSVSFQRACVPGKAVSFMDFIFVVDGKKGHYNPGQCTSYSAGAGGGIKSSACTKHTECLNTKLPQWIPIPC